MKNVKRYWFLAKLWAKILKRFTEFCWNFEIESVQRIANLVVLEKCCKMRIWVQRSASMQKRTSLLKFDHFCWKIQNFSASNLSTKERAAAAGGEALRHLHGPPLARAGRDPRAEQGWKMHGLASDRIIRIFQIRIRLKFCQNSGTFLRILQKFENCAEFSIFWIIF